MAAGKSKLYGRCFSCKMILLKIAGNPLIYAIKCGPQIWKVIRKYPGEVILYQYGPMKLLNLSRRISITCRQNSRKKKSSCLLSKQRTSMVGFKGSPYHTHPDV
jgi:hypothetical protein